MTKPLRPQPHGRHYRRLSLGRYRRRIAVQPRRFLAQLGHHSVLPLARHPPISQDRKEFRRLDLKVQANPRLFTSMKTDTLFYELFSRSPGVALQLAGLDPSCADAYEFRSEDRRAEALARATTGPSSNSSKLRLSNSKLGRFACLTPTAWNSFRAANPAHTSRCTIVLRAVRAWLQFSKIATSAWPSVPTTASGKPSSTPASISMPIYRMSSSSNSPFLPDHHIGFSYGAITGARLKASKRTMVWYLM